jgi:hypothetical protein
VQGNEDGIRFDEWENVSLCGYHLTICSADEHKSCFNCKSSQISVGIFTNMKYNLSASNALECPIESFPYPTWKKVFSPELILPTETDVPPTVYWSMPNLFLSPFWWVLFGISDESGDCRTSAIISLSQSTSWNLIAL